MEATTTSPGSPAPDLGLPAGAPPEVGQAVRGATSPDQMTGKQEKSAIAWLLGPVAPLPYHVDVKYDTPEGLKLLRFHMTQLDAAELEVIEKRNRSGDGPFAELNTRVYNAQVVTAATRYIEDPNAEDSRMEFTDPAFRMGIPDPAIAVEKRFAFQPGILRGLVAEIREMAGNSEDRIGTAQRALVDAAGNS